MDIVVRLLLRFILIPLGYAAAALAGSGMILFGSWRIGEAALSADPDGPGFVFLGIAIAGPLLIATLLAVMWLPSAVGILLSEAFALRSWMFHVANGVVSAWIGWNLFEYFDDSRVPLNEPLAVVAAGIAGGFVYWAIAGFSAGFWKPVFREDVPRPATNVATPR